MNLNEISKYIALILRHKPETIGISLDEHGWASVDELIAGISRDHTFNMEMLEEIVSTDNKQRYSFNEDKTLIRASLSYIRLNHMKWKKMGMISFCRLTRSG